MFFQLSSSVVIVWQLINDPLLCNRISGQQDVKPMINTWGLLMESFQSVFAINSHDRGPSRHWLYPRCTGSVQKSMEFLMQEIWWVYPFIILALSDRCLYFGFLDCMSQEWTFFLVTSSSHLLIRLSSCVYSSALLRFVIIGRLEKLHLFFVVASSCAFDFMIFETDNVRK